MQTDQEFRLPDGRTVACLSAETAAGVWHEVRSGALAAAAGRLRDDDVVLDIGAHIGLASLFVAAGRRLRLVACEPAPPSFRCLRTNLARHVPGAVALDVAVGDRTGRVPLTYYPGVETLTTLHEDDADDRRNIQVALAHFGFTDPRQQEPYWQRARAGTRRFEVEITTVHDVLRDQALDRVDLLKVDVERAEMEVLRGLDADDWARVRTVVVEVHDLQGRLAEIRALLSGHGFEVTAGQEPLLAGGSMYTVTGRRSGDAS